MENRLYFSHRDNRANIFELQTYLRYLSRYYRDISDIVPDGIFGVETENSLKTFQKRFGLPITGNADFETWTRLVEVYDELVRAEKNIRPIHVYPIDAPPLREGDSFEEIYVLQVMLRRLSKIFKNIPLVDITGVFDAKTKKAVEEVARIYEKDTKGRVDRELWNIMADVYSAFTFND